MRERLLPVGVLAGALFVVNVMARLVVRLVGEKDDFWIGVVALSAVGVLMALAATWWMRRHLTPRVTGDLVVGAFVGGLLSSLVGPLVSTGRAFADGFGGVLAQVFYYLLVSGAGALVGALVIVIAGLDHKSQSWKRYAETINTNPRRVVRS